MRPTIDANVFVSALMVAGSRPARVIEAWDDGRFELVISRSLLDELAEVFARPHIRGRLDPVLGSPQGLLDRLRRWAIVVAPDEHLAVVASDPDDDRVIEAAIAGGADYIVSGDNDLLDLGEYEGIPILTPAQFLALLATD